MTNYSWLDRGMILYILRILYIRCGKKLEKHSKMRHERTFGICDQTVVGGWMVKDDC